jgi:hypothetical protein
LARAAAAARPARRLARLAGGWPPAQAALAANKRCIAAATDPERDGYADEISETRTLYDHPETRHKE